MPEATEEQATTVSPLHDALIDAAYEDGVEPGIRRSKRALLKAAVAGVRLKDEKGQPKLSAAQRKQMRKNLTAIHGSPLVRKAEEAGQVGTPDFAKALKALKGSGAFEVGLQTSFSKSAVEQGKRLKARHKDTLVTPGARHKAVPDTLTPKKLVADRPKKQKGLTQHAKAAVSPAPQ